MQFVHKSFSGEKFKPETWDKFCPVLSAVITTSAASSAPIGKKIHFSETPVSHNALGTRCCYDDAFKVQSGDVSLRLSPET